jgi:hypothetical protein
MPTASGRFSASDSAKCGDTAACAVLMVRPAHFGWNPETQASNSYQRNDASVAFDGASRARNEFDALAASLRTAGVQVHVADDRAEPACADAVFPNNWVSFHRDGTVVLYPMLSPNRRLERRTDLLLQLEQAGGFEVRRLVDLTHHEANGAFLEGTGSLVLDHAAKVAYACLSPRTHHAPLAEFCDQLGYEPVVFQATDPAGQPVYHTNVVLSVGPALAVVAVDNIKAADRERLVASVARPGRVVVEIDREQTAGFAANVLELCGNAGAHVLALSDRALRSFTDAQRALIRGVVDGVVSVPIPTIETLGGGSVRCMLAEVFLPRRRDR